jgi:sarcosine oxidase
VIVIGVGGFGSGAFYHLAKRGIRVLGIEQFGIAHDQGSSHGETRIIRKAYFEHPNYVPLAIRAYELWRELEEESKQELMRLSGVLLAGPPKGQAVSGAKTSAKEHGLLLEELTPKEAASRFPGLKFDEGFAVVYEPDAGYLHVEKCVEAHITEAVKCGGVLKTREMVLDWSSDSKRVTVRTSRGQYEAAGLVATVGPWVTKLLRDIPMPLKVLRKPVFWALVHDEYRTLRKGQSRFRAKSGVFSSPADDEFYAGIHNWPGFLFELSEGVFYGLPGLNGRSLKLAEHTGGQAVDDPPSATRKILLEDRRRIHEFIRQCVPAARTIFQRQSVCFYTMTPDAHFLIDRHPAHSNVVFGAGFSGHGFKFTSVLGLALAEMISNGSTSLPVDFLALSRRGLM